MSNRKIALIILLLLSGCFAAYIAIVVIPARIVEHTYEGAKQIGEDIRSLFNFTPEITVDNTVVVEQQTSVLELASLAQKFQHQYEWTNQWLKSTKKITITGRFEAKAGFDLREKIEVSIHDDHAIIRLPQPKLLSIESIGDIKFEDENGIWNWVNQEDRSKAINAFLEDAKRYAANAPFVQESKTRVEEQLKNVLELHEKDVSFEYTEPLQRGKL